MNLTRVDSSTTSVTFYRFSNVFLVREKDGFTLVDTSLPGSASTILEAAKVYETPIRRIVLTHAHGDHVGSLDALHKQLGPAVAVAIGKREAPMLHKDLSLRPDEPQTPLHAFQFPGTTTRPTHTLTDGELFGSLRCIDTPGHSPGHMSFFDEREGTLFTGDALVSMIGKLDAVAHAPWYFPNLFTWNNPMADASARKLLELQPRTIVTGHGRVVHDGTATLRRSLERAGIL